jgi:hypothetical protein
MTPPEEHIWNGPATILRRASVLRVLKQTICERFVRRRAIVSKGSWKLPRHRVYQDHRREFATSQNIVADRNFAVHKIVDKPLVEPLVATTNEDQARQLGQLPDQSIIKPLTLGRETDHVAGLAIEGLDS